MREVLNRRLKPAFRNEANEPPVVKNVCALFSRDESRSMQACPGHVRDPFDLFQISFHFGFRSKEE